MMSDVYMVMASYAAVILLGFGLINWLSGGFIIQFAKVKMSRGKKTLIRVRGVSGDYFRPGEITEGWLVFKDKQKQNRRVVVPNRSFIAYAMGVKTVDLDDETNALANPDFSVVAGFDAVKHENLYVRALTAPHLDDKTLKIILLIVAIVGLLILANIVLTYKLGGKIDALSVVSTIAKSTI